MRAIVGSRHEPSECVTSEAAESLRIDARTHTAPHAADDGGRDAEAAGGCEPVRAASVGDDEQGGARYSGGMQVTVRGHRWRLVFMDRLPSGAAGECDQIGVPDKAIWVATQQRPVDVLDTLIHELLHAALPDLCEEAVEETATDIARVLNRLGVTVDDE
tara:strand:- start:2492 stop:2971 length:480 start_codon:yes stop_codon:yes gene_type:complete